MGCLPQNEGYMEVQFAPRFKDPSVQATVESIFLYRTETWTITESLKKRIDGCYSRMLQMALNPPKRGLERTSHQQGGLWITPKS